MPNYIKNRYLLTLMEVNYREIYSDMLNERGSELNINIIRNNNPGWRILVGR